MSEKHCDSDWNYEIKPFKDSPIRHYCSFKGLPLPDNDVYNLLGMGEVEKVDRIIKEIIHWREIMYGKDSKQALFPHPVIRFKHCSQPNIELDCMSGTEFWYAPRKLRKIYNSFPERWESADNYRIVFSAKVQEILKNGGNLI